MKKLFLFLAVFVFNTIEAQVDYSKVLGLLLDNKREEARTLFDNQFSKSKASNIDLIFLDALIDEELGRMDYDASLIKSIENLPNSQYYIDPFINSYYLMGNINSEGFDDLIFEKIDYLANSEKFKDLLIVKYRKAIADRKRLNYTDSTKMFLSINAINKWQFCGVFENLNGSGLDTEYEPETYAKSDKLFDANSNGKVGWYKPKSPQNEIYHFFSNEAEYGNGIIYAQTFVTIPHDKTYLLSFGTEKGIKVFVNDIEIYSNSETGVNNIDAYNFKINLKKGNNRLLFKVDTDGGSYFSAILRNVDFSFPSEVMYNDSFLPYQASTLEDLSLEEIALPYEKYFEDLSKSDPNNVLHKLYLYQVYAANQKKEKAFDAIEGLDKKYPKSSLISRYFVKYYTLEDESQKVEEISKNIESIDKDYFFCTVNKMKDNKWMRNAPIKELEEYIDKSKKYKSKLYSIMFEFLLSSRKLDKDKMFNLMNELLVYSHNNENYQSIVANLYLQLKDDKTKYAEMLENIVKTRENFQVYTSLIDYYNDANRKDAVKDLILRRINNYPFYNVLRNDYITILNNENKYDEALKYINENLEYFPYSYSNLQSKAEAYINLKDIKQAEKNIRESLSHNSGNSNLRKQLYDITKIHDEIEDVETKNIYDFIKKKRHTSLKGDYGVTFLLDEYIINILPEGGRKSKVNYVYEITSENGIQEMKEYSIDTYTNNIIKAEIIKEDGSIVPADTGGDTIVFPDLKVGDVILIQYDRFQNSYGRFFKDFDVSCYFNNTYPESEVSFTLIYPQDVKFITNYSNGNVPSTAKKINNKNCIVWKKTNVPAIPLQEAYSPTYSDITNVVRASTISSWKEISNWYSDLVKKNLKIDKITRNTFNEIFKDGISNLSDEEKAKKIYYYIANNINYSSQDFRQSGYVPQKPSKTITTKLGDCKDVSTLFVALSQLAEIKANLVLVSTNDNGFTSMALPSNEFNHCIVKVILDKKDYFIELTDKYLPFKALPVNLYKANALVISFDKTENENSKIINIPFDNVPKNISKSNTILNIDDKGKNFINTFEIQGSGKAYYNELFSSGIAEVPAGLEIDDKVWNLICTSAKIDKYILLLGPKGCGKTETAKQLAAATGMELVSFNMGAAFKPKQMFAGMLQAENGDTVFIESEFLKAFQSETPTLIFLDELTRTPQVATNYLMTILDRNQSYIYIVLIYHPLLNLIN